MLDLSIRVLRDDLERLGRFDADRRRRRMRANFDGGGMRIVEIDGHPVGCFGLNGDELHSMFLEPSRQGRGLGAAIVAAIIVDNPGRILRLEVLKQSRARRFWERQGFVCTGEQPFDWLMQRPAAD